MMKRFVELDGDGRVITDLQVERDTWEASVQVPPALVDVSDVPDADGDLQGRTFNVAARQFGPRPPRVIVDRLAALEAKIEAIARKVGA